MISVTLRMSSITVRYGDFVANDNVSIAVECGEIRALLGENGAGKSTLMNVLFGLRRPDAGAIEIAGVTHRFAGPEDAIRAGIGMVHQHFMLVPVFTVAENLMLGDERVGTPWGSLSSRLARQRVRDLSERYGLSVDPDALVEDLSVGVQQRVEILKALSRNAEILVLDEPTAVLTPGEIDELATVLNTLRAEGKAIIFISHKLREVRELADTVTVMRHGRVVSEPSPRASEQELAALMVGRTLAAPTTAERSTPGPDALTIEGLRVRDDRGERALDDLVLSVRSGEILGVAGVEGNGQKELAEAIMGLRPVEGGSITLADQRVDGLSTSRILDLDVGYIPEDRQRSGVVASMDIAQNLVLDLIRTPRYARYGTLRRAQIQRNGQELMGEFDIRAPRPTTPVGALSGGNQQKVILARAMSRPLRLLLACQPTRGVDVGAQQAIHRRIVAERDRGTAVLLISGDLDEVLTLADRVAVLSAGRVVDVVSPAVGRERVGLLMAGGASARTPGGSLAR